ncbi:Malonyl-[acyl-carrier protein] O-methyltransferase [compost metagenome]
MYPSAGIDKGFLMDSAITTSASGTREPSEAYDLAAGSYDKWQWQEFWRRTETPFFDDCVESHDFAHRRRFLDAGCGTGYYLDRYGILFREQDGFDPSTGMLAVASRRCPEARLAVGRVSSLPYSTSMFDLIVCARVLSHVADLVPVISELVRVTAPGGAILLSSIDASHPYTATRLPTGAGDVFAETFKHDRGTVLELLSAAGMRIVSTTLIEADGRLVQDGAAFPPVSAPVTAWAVMAVRPKPLA